MNSVESNQTSSKFSQVQVLINNLKNSNFSHSFPRKTYRDAIHVIAFSNLNLLCSLPKIHLCGWCAIYEKPQTLRPDNIH